VGDKGVNILQSTIYDANDHTKVQLLLIQELFSHGKLEVNNDGVIMFMGILCLCNIIVL